MRRTTDNLYEKDVHGEAAQILPLESKQIAQTFDFAVRIIHPVLPVLASPEPTVETVFG